MKRAPRGVALACAMICLMAAAVFLDSRSKLAESLRSGYPLIGSAWIRFQGQGRVVPPEVYVLLYVPAARRLEIVSAESLADVYSRVYAESGDVLRASRAMASEAVDTLLQDPTWPPGARAISFQLELSLTANPASADPAEIKERLVGLLAPFSRARAREDRYAAPGLSRYDALLLAWILRRLGPDRIGFSLMPAPDATAAFLSRVLNRPREDKQGPITAEVLNASGAGGLALKTTKILRWHGIDVVDFGNAAAQQASTRFIDKVGLPGYARSVREFLGCTDAQVLTEMEGRPRASVAVVLGRDFARCGALKD